MYKLLADFTQRPAPFSRSTVKELWTRPHLARQMLVYHLNQETELASRPLDAIEKIVAWIDGELDLSGKRLCDLGCGPGLYAQRFADRGSPVVGIDFSAHSLDYAREHNASGVQYIEADYLEDELPQGFDVVSLIYTDLCPLSPAQRDRLLGRMRDMLNPGGKIVLDVASTHAFDQRIECTQVEDRLMGGFWAEGDYLGLQKTFLYPDLRVALDRFLIVEPTEHWQICNWMQYFSPAEISAELETAGFRVDRMVGGLQGDPLSADSDLIGIIASPN